MFIQDFILLIEKLGLPTFFVICSGAILWQSMKQASRRDELNSQIHQSHIEVQKRQNEILDKLSNRIHEDNNNIQTAIDSIKKDLEHLLKSNHSETMDTIRIIVEKIDNLPNIFNDAQKAYDTKIQTGFSHFLTEIKTIIEKLVKEKEEHDKDDKKVSTGVIDTGDKRLLVDD